MLPGSDGCSIAAATRRAQRLLRLKSLLPAVLSNPALPDSTIERLQAEIQQVLGEFDQRQLQSLAVDSQSRQLNEIG